MQYTLSMIHDQLINRLPFVSALSGDDVLFKAPRFCKPPESPEEGVLYLYNLDTDTTLVHSGGSFFTVSANNYAETCGEIIDICQYYDRWEKDLHEMVWEKQDFQQMIDRTDEIFGNPIFICNWQGNVLGYSEKYQDVEIRRFWHVITHEKRVPISSLAALMDSEYSNLLYEENQVHLLDFPELKYRSLFGLVHINSEIVLQFQIIEHDRKLKASDRYLAMTFLDSLRHSFRESQMAAHQSSFDVFKKLMSGVEVTEQSLDWVLDYIGWGNSDHEYCLIAFSNRDGSDCDSVLFPQLERHIPGCKLLDHDGQMIMLIPLKVLQRFSKELRYTINLFHIYGGVSLPFRTWNALPRNLKQAKSALQHCSTNAALSYSIDYSWENLLDVISANKDASELLHPAVSILRNYDITHETEFANTLKTYLSHERSNVKTAESLYIHRNTLKYRIDKISQLIDVDLENPDVRMHILISFLLLEKSDKY